MPALITHYLGGQSAIKSLSSEIRGYLATMGNIFNLGTQGPDIFFYYINGFITKRIRGIGTQMHNQDLGRFFMHMASTIKEAKSPSQRKIVFAYTAGFLAHYAMDVNAHSYVYAQTSAPQGSGLEESTRHRHFEAAIDILMLHHMCHMQPSDLDQAKLITPDEIHKRAAAAAMASAMRDVYYADIHPWDVYRAMGQMARNTGLLESKTGRRKRWLGRVEAMTVRSRIISSLIHTQSVSDGVDYLNIEKTSWCAPWDADNTRDESFLELFDAAVEEAEQMIQALYDYINRNLHKNQFESKIMNRSLKTGVDAAL